MYTYGTHRRRNYVYVNYPFMNRKIVSLPNSVINCEFFVTIALLPDPSNQ